MDTKGRINSFMLFGQPGHTRPIIGMEAGHDKLGHPGPMRAGNNLCQVQRQGFQIQMTVGINQTGPIFRLQNILIAIHYHRL